MNVKKQWAGLALAILTLIGSVAAPLATLSAQGNATVLTVGYIGASRGAQAALDQSNYQAAVLAAEQINTSDDYGVISDGNVRYRFEVVYYTADSAAEAADAYVFALIDGAIAVLGPQQERQIEAILNAEGTLDLPLLAADAGDLAGESNVFQISSTQDDWVEAAADYLTEELHLSHLVTVAVDTETAQAGADLFVDLAGEDNVALTITHAADADDLSSEAQDIVDADADGLFVWTLDAQGELLLEALADAGWRGPIVYVGLDEDVIANADPALVNDLIGLAPWSATAYDAYSQRFVEDYVARWGATPSEDAAAYYDAITLLAAAVQAADDDPDDISRALANLGAIEGVQGTYADGATTGLRLMSVRADGSETELAYYDSGECLSCTDANFVLLDDDTLEDAEIEPYNIALIATLSGASAGLGESAQQGAELAIRELQKRGGVLGADGIVYDLRLGAYDATTASTAATAFANALQDGADIILGPDSNAQVIDNSRLPGEAGVLQLVSATGIEASGLSSGENILQIRPSDSTLAAAAVHYLLEERGFEQVAAVSVRSNYGNEAARAIEETFEDLDAESALVLDLQHNSRDTDYAAMAARVVESGAQAVLVWSAQPVAQGLLDELGAAGWTGTLVYGYLTPAFLETVIVPHGIELIGAVSWWPAAGDGTSAGFVDRYAARYDEAPTAQSAAYYDAVMLIAQAIQAVGPATDDIEAWLSDEASLIGVQGVYDPASDTGGELTRSVMMLGVNTGSGVESVYEAARYLDGVCYSHCAAGSTVWRYPGSAASASSTSSSTSDLRASLPSSLRDKVVIVETGYNLNLRPSPSYDEDVDIDEVIPYETELPAFAISEDGAWIVVYYDGQFGWVLLDYVTVIDGSLSTLEVTDREF